jgi:hypothetical protein
MAGHSFLLDLVIGLVTLLSYTFALEITDIFTVHDGSRDGGCDGYMQELDQWLGESSYSIATAVEALDRYAQDIRIRRSMSIFFGIYSVGKLGAEGVRREDFASVQRKFESETRFLFNGFSSFLSSSQRTIHSHVSLFPARVRRYD